MNKVISKIFLLWLLAMFMLLVSCASKKKIVENHSNTSTSSHSAVSSIERIHTRTYDSLIRIPQRSTAAVFSFTELLALLDRKNNTAVPPPLKSIGQGISAQLSVNPSDSSFTLSASSDSAYILIKALSERISYIERNTAKDSSAIKEISYKELFIKTRSLIGQYWAYILIFIAIVFLPDIGRKIIHYLKPKIPKL